MAKITINAFKKAIEGSRGIKKAIADNLNVSRKAVYDFLRKFPDLQQLIDDEKEVFIDEVEQTFYSKAKLGENWAVKYCLETHGKSRGYTLEEKKKEIGTPKKSCEFDDLLRILCKTPEDWKIVKDYLLAL